jgi:hypothetical protein
MHELRLNFRVNLVFLLIWALFLNGLIVLLLSHGLVFFIVVFTRGPTFLTASLTLLSEVNFRNKLRVSYWSRSSWVILIVRALKIIFLAGTSFFRRSFQRALWKRKLNLIPKRTGFLWGLHLYVFLGNLQVNLFLNGLLSFFNVFLLFNILLNFINFEVLNSWFWRVHVSKEIIKSQFSKFSRHDWILDFFSRIFNLNLLKGYLLKLLLIGLRFNHKI